MSEFVIRSVATVEGESVRAWDRSCDWPQTTSIRRPLINAGEPLGDELITCYQANGTQEYEMQKTVYFRRGSALLWLVCEFKFLCEKLNC